MADLEVSEDALNAIADALRSAASQLRSDNAELSGSMAATQSEWTGEAASAAASSHASWSERLLTQVDYMESIATAVDNANERYQQTDNTVANIWPL